MSRAPAAAAADREETHYRKVHIVQGEYFVSEDPDVVLVTLLGSCVAACVRDPVARVGGMNHFLLPGDDKAARNGEAERYGVHLMELLVNGLLRRGARKDRLEAKLFGGARTIENFSDIGQKNVAFAERFLKTENIAYIGGNCGGDSGRRLQFWPICGRARQALIVGVEVPVAVAPPPSQTADVEFF
ncbi:MAG: chemotaxis protein CheD [Methylovirgula sp.]|nr:chemotaxis protein CheD [Methylovirgula sp.]